MDAKHVKAIQDNFAELVDKTTKIKDIIQKLEKRRILNSNMVKYLLMWEENRKCLKEFYEMIQGRGPRAFEMLLLSLRETENFRAQQILLKDNFKTYDFSSSPETKLFPSDISEDEFDGMQISELEVKVHPDRKFMDIDEENQPLGTYRMRSKPRGHALIINIYKTLNDDDRKGSEVDEKKLNKLFKELGYKVVSRTNLNLKQMQDVIREFCADPALAKVDSTVVFIMSHGKEYRPGDTSTDLITSDGRNLNTKWIIDQFFSSDSKLVSKVEERKPKLFFFQACRCPEDETIRSKNVRSWENNAVETDSILLSNGLAETRKYEDTLQIFSTIGGYPSMRDRVTGAWYVHKFCEIVAENAWIYDLETMLGMVDDELRKLKSSKYGYQTSEVVKQGVSKKVFFNPGL